MKADHTKVKRQLSIVRGQMDGILKMVDEDAYCIDISNQILSSIAMLKNANREIISAHLDHCLKHAANEEDRDNKINEIRDLLNRMD